jgi:hypothetical protein
LLPNIERFWFTQANNGNVDIVHTRDSMALQLLSAAPLRPDFES